MPCAPRDVRISNKNITSKSWHTWNFKFRTSVAKNLEKVYSDNVWHWNEFCDLTKNAFSWNFSLNKDCDFQCYGLMSFANVDWIHGAVKSDSSLARLKFIVVFIWPEIKRQWEIDRQDSALWRPIWFQRFLTRNIQAKVKI